MDLLEVEVCHAEWRIGVVKLRGRIKSDEVTQVVGVEKFHATQLSYHHVFWGLVYSVLEHRADILESKCV
jgi:hypothetical protein